MMVKKYTYLVIIFLIVASCASFGRIANNDFITYDDDKYITENSDIKSGFNFHSVKLAFSTVVAGNWHPLTLLSHMLDWNLFGANAAGHHLASLLFHIGTVIFLFLFLFKATHAILPAAFAAAFFAIHPLRVESVAWASERKDVLSMFFGMACIYAYAFYYEKPHWAKYILCLLLFALALMAKPMLVTLPFVLLLLDGWPLRRWLNPQDQRGRFLLNMKLVVEKIPFIFLTATVSVITLFTQSKTGATSFGDTIPFTSRISNSIVSYISYLYKTLWPVNLALFYPYDFSVPAWEVFIAGLLISAVTLGVIYHIKKIPALFVGWFWYLGTLVPVIGLVQVGTQAMADRYTYLPSVGIAIMLAWGISSLIKNYSIRQKTIFPAAFVVIAILALLTWVQCRHWKNSITVWTHASRVIKNNYLAYSRLGNAYGEMKQYQKAIDNFNKVLRVKPDYEIAFNGKGLCYNAMGMPRLAVDEFNKALHFKPDYAAAYNNRALSYFMLGNKISGCADAKKACALGECKIFYFFGTKGFCK